MLPAPSAAPIPPQREDLIFQTLDHLEDHLVEYYKQLFLKVRVEEISVATDTEPDEDCAVYGFLSRPLQECEPFEFVYMANNRVNHRRFGIVRGMQPLAKNLLWLQTQDAAFTIEYLDRPTQ